MKGAYWNDILLYFGYTKQKHEAMLDISNVKCLTNEVVYLFELLFLQSRRLICTIYKENWKTSFK